MANAGLGYSPGRGAVGSALMRIEDERFLTGRGRFLADLQPAGRVHAAFLRSPHAHARVVALDLEAVRRAPGVLAVIGPSDLPSARSIPLMPLVNALFAKAMGLEVHEPPVPLLAGERLVYVGQPIAMVVAGSRAAAEDALELAELEADPLPPLIEAEDALNGPGIYPGVPGNLAGRLALRRGQPSTAAHMVRARFQFGRQGAVPLETRGVMAMPEERTGRIMLWTSTQIPHRLRAAVAHVLGWPQEQLRVITPDLGGAFGTKGNIYPEEALVALCAKMLGRPVVWVEDRTEHLLAAAQSRDQVHEVELGLDDSGRIVSYHDDFTINLGAHNLWLVGVLANTILHATGPYRVPFLEASGRAVVTNKAPTSQLRGAGRPEACFAIERALDIAARRLGIDRFEIRRRNLIRADEMPYEQGYLQRDGVPIVLESSDYPAVFERAIELAGPDAWPALRREAAARGEDLGVGCATYTEATGRGPFEGAVVRALADGNVEVATGAANAGQGLETSLGRVCAESLEIDPARVRMTNGDTDRIARGVGSFASRTAVVAGNAVLAASRELRLRAQAVAAEALGCRAQEVTWIAGRAVGPDGTAVELARLAAIASTGAPLEATCYYTPRTVTWTMGAHVAVVSVDPRTGGVRVLAYGAAHDRGRNLDQQIVEGQILGGIAQGLGGALLEEFEYAADGQPQSTTLADYRLASAAEMPTFQLADLPSATDNPLGVKGVGESGIIAVAAAIANAVSDALGGAECNATPLSPSHVWRIAGGSRG